MRFFALILTVSILKSPELVRAQSGDACEQPAANQPQLTRSSPNKIPNPHVAGGANWTLVAGAVIDSTVSRTRDGSGSIDLSAPGSQAQSSPIPVVPGTTYIFSAYLQSTDWPTLAYMSIGIRDASQKFVTTANTDYQGATAANRWQEIAVTFTAASGDAFVNLTVGRHDVSHSPGVAGKLWVDDLYFGEGISFEQPFTPKVPFDGGLVKVDELGNFTVLTNGVWTPYFPFCVYFGSPQPDFQPFSEQGFNCLMRNTGLSSIQNGRNAVSAFNPNGLMSLPEITQYLLPTDTQTYNNLPALRSYLASLMQSPLLSSVLGFYWDNEEYNQYEVPRGVTETVKQADTVNGVRFHPIYMLDGVQADSRLYAQLEDVVGDYLADDTGSGTNQPLRAQSTSERFPISYNLEGQSRPVTFGNISEEFYPERLRRLVYQALIAGVKAISYYREGDCQTNYNGPPGGCIQQMSLRPSWTEFPALRQEVEQLLPLLHEPRWTSWTAASTNSPLQFGTRDHECDGYLMVVNPSAQDMTSTFTISKLSYTPAAAVDYFLGLSGRVGNTATPVAPVSQGKFTVTLPANQTAVYHLSRSSLPVGLKPVIAGAGRVSGFGGGDTVSPGDWIEINGSDLSATTRKWADSDFWGKLAPTALDGVHVTIAGKEAYVYSISPDRIKAQIPDGVAAGSANLVAGNSVGSSDPYVLRVTAKSVAALRAPDALQINGLQYAAASLADGTLVLPDGALPDRASRPAHPGETITLYGLGFGSVTPQTWGGTKGPASSTLVTPVQILFGTTAATITYQGLSPGMVGLYRFDVVVPDIDDNDAVPLVVSAGGNVTGQTLFTAVSK